MEIFFGPEYNLIPEGIEDFKDVTGVIVGDHNLGFSNIYKILKVFDHIFSDKKGIEVLKRVGYNNVTYVPMFFFDRNLHNPDDVTGEEERDIDILFVGNLNSEVQVERTKFLWKISQLPKNYQILITWGIYGVEYANLLKRSKIVFNRSIRSEANMRLFEATASGALLFQEEENLEARDFFSEDEIVYYNENNILDLLVEYLSDKGKRIKKIKNALERVKNYHTGKRWEIIEDVMSRVNKQREIPDDITHLKLKNAFQASLSKPHEFNNFRTGIMHIKPTLDLKISSETLNDAAAMLFLHGYLFGISDNNNKAITLLEKALTFGDNLLIHFNLGNAYRILGDVNKSLLHYKKALESKHTSLSIPFVFEFGIFKTEWEKIFEANCDDQQKLVQEISKLLIWSTLDSIGDILSKKGSFFEALDTYKYAQVIRPDIARTRYKAGKLLCALKRYNEALEDFKEAIKIDPSRVEFWDDVILSSYNSDKEYFEKIVEEFRAFLRCCPFALNRIKTAKYKELLI